MSWKNWVLDGTFGWPAPFCPIEGDINGEFSVVVGMNVLATTPPGKMVGIVHADGQEAVEAFCRKHKTEIDKIYAAIKRREGNGQELSP